MNFQWTTNEIAKTFITIYSTNITLNKAACRYFENVSYVLLGLDEDENVLGIKPVDKQAIDQQLYPEDQLHRISVGKSYGRVSNKTFIDYLRSKYDLDVDANHGIKLKCKYDVIHQILLIQL